MLLKSLSRKADTASEMHPSRRVLPTLDRRGRVTAPEESRMAHPILKLRLSLMGRPVRNYAFEKDTVAVGRDPNHDVFVDNPGISRDHFRLERTEQGEYRLTDLGSANGTFVNDRMVNSVVVRDNDIVRFGKYTLWVGYEADRRAKPRVAETTVATGSEGPRHTVVLSRAEVGALVERERAPEAKILALPLPGGARHVPPPATIPAWAVPLGFVLGFAAGAVVVWLTLHR